MKGLPAKVSIVVPVYNVEKYLSDCLNSCIHQTLYDIEIICVNDGSTDHSPDILREFAGIDSRITIVNKQNGGLSSARNAGIKAACGEMIMFLDSDDYLAPNACERVWEETKEAPTDIVVFGTHIFPEIPPAEIWYYQVLHIRTKRYWKFAPSVLFREPGAKPFVWRQAYHRKFFEEYGLLFDEQVRYGEDIVFQMELFPYANNISFISDRLYHYRWYREGSLMSSFRFSLDEKIRQHLSIAGIVAKYWQEKGWLKLYGKDFVAWILEFLVYDIKTKDVEFAQEHLNNLNQLLKTYELEQYLKEMPFSKWWLVRTVKKGRS